MKAATIVCTILGNMLAGKSETPGRGVIEAGNGTIRFGEGTTRAGQNFLCRLVLQITLKL